MNNVFHITLQLNPEESEVKVISDVNNIFLDQRKNEILYFLSEFDRQLSEVSWSVRKKFNFLKKEISNYDDSGSLRSYKNFCITSDEDFIEDLKEWACEFSYAHVSIDEIIIEELEPLS